MKEAKARADVLESYVRVGVDSSYQVTFGSTRSLHGTEISMAPAIACFRKFDGVRSYGTAGWATGNPSRWRFPVTSMMDRCSNAREKGGVVTQV